MLFVRNVIWLSRGKCLFLSRTRGLYGERYFMIFVDDFTRMMWVAFLKEKSEALEKLRYSKT